MSSETSSQYVKLEVMLTKIEALAGEIHAIESQQAKLPELKRQLQKEQLEVIQLLERCDVRASGNTGWEGRIIVFLLGLRRAAKERYAPIKSSSSNHDDEVPPPTYRPTRS